MGTETVVKTEAAGRDVLVAAVGETAGRVWRLLNADGEMTLARLGKELSERPERIAMAIGWLAREDKVVLTAKGNTTRVALKERAPNW